MRVFVDTMRVRRENSVYVVRAKVHTFTAEEHDRWIAAFCSQSLAELFIEECGRWDTFETEDT